MERSQLDGNAPPGRNRLRVSVSDPTASNPQSAQTPNRGFAQMAAPPSSHAPGSAAAISAAAAALTSSTQPIGGTQSKLEHMLEAQMIADIVRANASLKQFKAFRATSEKHFQDRATEEAKRLQVQAPLEAALTEIDLLRGKVQRRDVLIDQLRRQVYSEILHSLQLHSSGTVADPAAQQRTQQHLHEVQLSEELRHEELSDTLDLLRPVLMSQQQQITKLKALATTQQEKMRRLGDEIETLEALHREELRSCMADRDTFSGLLDGRENRLTQVLEEKQQMLEALQRERELVARLRKELQDSIEKQEGSQKSLDSTAVERDDLRRQAKQWEIEERDREEELSLMQDKLLDLQKRYDGLVHELDELVERGVFLPEDGTSELDAPPKTIAPGRRNSATSVSISQAISQSQQGTPRNPMVPQSPSQQQLQSAHAQKPPPRTNFAAAAQPHTKKKLSLSVSAQQHSSVSSNASSSTLPPNTQPYQTSTQSSHAPAVQQQAQRVPVQSAASNTDGVETQEGRFAQRRASEELQWRERALAVATERAKQDAVQNALQNEGALRDQLAVLTQEKAQLSSQLAQSEERGARLTRDYERAREGLIQERERWKDEALILRTSTNVLQQRLLTRDQEQQAQRSSFAHSEDADSGPIGDDLPLASSRRASSGPLAKRYSQSLARSFSISQAALDGGPDQQSLRAESRLQDLLQASVVPERSDPGPSARERHRSLHSKTPALPEEEPQIPKHTAAEWRNLREDLKKSRRKKFFALREEKLRRHQQREEVREKHVQKRVVSSLRAAQEAAEQRGEFLSLQEEESLRRSELLRLHEERMTALAKQRDQHLSRERDRLRAAIDKRRKERRQEELRQERERRRVERLRKGEDDYLSEDEDVLDEAKDDAADNDTNEDADDEKQAAAESIDKDNGTGFVDKSTELWYTSSDEDEQEREEVRKQIVRELQHSSDSSDDFSALSDQEPNDVGDVGVRDKVTRGEEQTDVALLAEDSLSHHSDSSADSFDRLRLLRHRRLRRKTNAESNAQIPRQRNPSKSGRHAQSPGAPAQELSQLLKHVFAWEQVYANSVESQTLNVEQLHGEGLLHERGTQLDWDDQVLCAMERELEKQEEGGEFPEEDEEEEEGDEEGLQDGDFDDDFDDDDNDKENKDQYGITSSSVLDDQRQSAGQQTYLRRMTSARRQSQQSRQTLARRQSQSPRMTMRQSQLHRSSQVGQHGRPSLRSSSGDAELVESLARLQQSHRQTVSGLAALSQSVTNLLRNNLDPGRFGILGDLLRMSEGLSERGAASDSPDEGPSSPGSPNQAKITAREKRRRQKEDRRRKLQEQQLEALRAQLTEVLGSSGCLGVEGRAKQTLHLLALFNELRNVFASQWRSITRERKSENGQDDGPGPLQLCLGVLDMFLQAIHLLLAPLEHLLRSDYPALLGVYPETQLVSTPFITQMAQTRIEPDNGNNMDGEPVVLTADHPRGLERGALATRGTRLSSGPTATMGLHLMPSSHRPSSPLRFGALRPSLLSHTLGALVQRGAKNKLGGLARRQFPREIDTLLDLIREAEILAARQKVQADEASRDEIDGLVPSQQLILEQYSSSIALANKEMADNYTTNRATRNRFDDSNAFSAIAYEQRSHQRSKQAHGEVDEVDRSQSLTLESSASAEAASPSLAPRPPSQQLISSSLRNHKLLVRSLTAAAPTDKVYVDYARRVLDPEGPDCRAYPSGSVRVKNVSGENQRASTAPQKDTDVGSDRSRQQPYLHNAWQELQSKSPRPSTTSTSLRPRGRLASPSPHVDLSVGSGTPDLGISVRSLTTSHGNKKVSTKTVVAPTSATTTESGLPSSKAKTAQAQLGEEEKESRIGTTTLDLPAQAGPVVPPLQFPEISSPDVQGVPPPRFAFLQSHASRPTSSPAFYNPRWPSTMPTPSQMPVRPSDPIADPHVDIDFTVQGKRRTQISRNGM